MFTLDRVVPWGRSFDEYRRMFALTDADLRLKIVGCGDGPASFNAEATNRGAAVVSVDPIYRWDVAQLRDRIAVTYDEILEQTRRCLRWAASGRPTWSPASTTSSRLDLMCRLRPFRTSFSEAATR